jgi:transcriptional regulator with XRE-family HTH domain
MVLLRRLIGDVLRRHRQRQGRTLREVSAAAQVSLGYLSEVERGVKEASSELLASICSALGVSLSEVLREVSDDLALMERPALSTIGFNAAPTTPRTVMPKPSRVPAVATLRPFEPAPVPGRKPTAPVASLSARPVVAA